MGKYALISKLAASLRVYRPTRWVYRQLVNRDEWRALCAERVFYRQFVRRNDLVFDVGANVGRKAEVFLSLGARVVAFEPQPAVHEELLARCGRPARMTLVRAALGAAAGEAVLHLTRSSTETASLVADWDADQNAAYTVKVRTLDDAIGEFGTPTFCKIDVEGYELEVFRGLTRPIPVISFEYHLNPRGRARVVDCLDYLDRFGRFEINYVADGMLAFGFQKWVSKEEFLPFFLHKIEGYQDRFFGDVFIRFAAGTSRL